MLKKAKIVQIGNSKGICILEGQVILEEYEHGILIYSKQSEKLTWEKTYKAMQASNEDWSGWQNVKDA